MTSLLPPAGRANRVGAGDPRDIDCSGHGTPEPFYAFRGKRRFPCHRFTVSLLTILTLSIRALFRGSLPRERNRSADF